MFDLETANSEIAVGSRLFNSDKILDIKTGTVTISGLTLAGNLHCHCDGNVRQPHGHGGNGRFEGPAGFDFLVRNISVPEVRRCDRKPGF